MLRSLTIASLLLVTPMSACGGGASAESPRAVADTLVKAFNAKDPALAVTLLPPVEALEAHFDCAGDSLVKARNRRAERAAKEFSEDRSKGAVMSVAAFDLEGSETKTLAVGETWQDCTVKKAAELHRSKLTLHIEIDGKTDDDGETWQFLKLDGKWYYAKL